MTKVKICGITNKEDAFWASSLGADFIGLNFYKNSVRKVSIKNAKEITDSLPSFTKAVCVFVNEDIKQLIKICNKINVEYVQLHGDEDIKYCKELKSLNFKIIKVFKIKSVLENNNIEEYARNLFENIRSYLDYIDCILFDTYTQSAFGGTGEVFCWDIVKYLKNILINNNITVNFFIAGGLTVENVEEVIKNLEPWGVDVASGVERLPRRKDFDKMKEFIRKVKMLK